MQCCSFYSVAAAVTTFSSLKYDARPATVKSGRHYFRAKVASHAEGGGIQTLDDVNWLGEQRHKYKKNKH
jgi:hypothetical protein